jgi:hypothetical protein
VRAPLGDARRSPHFPARSGGRHRARTLPPAPILDREGEQALDSGFAQREAGSPPSLPRGLKALNELGYTYPDQRPKPKRQEKDEKDRRAQRQLFFPQPRDSSLVEMRQQPSPQEPRPANTTGDEHDLPLLDLSRPSTRWCSQCQLLRAERLPQNGSRYDALCNVTLRD